MAGIEPGELRFQRVGAGLHFGTEFLVAQSPLVAQIDGEREAGSSRKGQKKRLRSSAIGNAEGLTLKALRIAVRVC